jgi:hypothetical protein
MAHRRPRPMLYLPMKGDISAKMKGTANSSAAATTTAAVVSRTKLRINIPASMFRRLTMMPV